MVSSDDFITLLESVMFSTELPSGASSAGGLLGALTLVNQTDLKLSFRSDAVLSPDGLQVVYFSEAGICAQAVDDSGLVGEATCGELERVSAFAGRQLRWSPDSRYVAFDELGARLLIDTDIWIFDTQDGSILDRTNDNIDGSFFPFSKGLPAYIEARSVIIRGLAWLPDESGLIVGAGTFDRSGFWAGNLYQYDLASGKAQPLLDMSEVETVDGAQKPFDAKTPIAPISLLPHDAYLLTDGTGLIFAGSFFRNTALWAVALPFESDPYTPDNLPPQVTLIEKAPLFIESTGIYQEGSAVRLLLGTLLLDLERE